MTVNLANAGENQDTKQNPEAYKYINGLDTISSPAFRSPDTSGYMINLVNKDGNNLKRRDGLREGVTLNVQKILGSYATPEDGSVYFAVIDNDGDAGIIRLAGNGTKLQSKVTWNPQLFKEGFRFKIISRYPSSSNNIYLYGTNTTDSVFAGTSYRSWEATLTTGNLTDFVQNTSITSNQVTVGTEGLKIIDHGIYDQALFCLVYNDTAQNFIVVYGDKYSPQLDKSYFLDNNIRATALIVEGNNIFIGGRKGIYFLFFQQDSSSTPQFNVLTRNIGIRHTWAYEIYDTYCYCFGEDTIFRFSLRQAQLVLSGQQSLTNILDKNIKNIIRFYTVFRVLVKAEENAIYFFGNFNCDFPYFSLFQWLRQKKNRVLTHIQNWTLLKKELLKNINAGAHWAIVFNVNTGSWHLCFFESRILGCDQYTRSVGFSSPSKTLVVTNNKKVLHLHRDYPLDDGSALEAIQNPISFPVTILNTNKNVQYLTGALMHLRSVYIALSNNVSPIDHNTVLSVPFDMAVNITNLSVVGLNFENQLKNTCVKKQENLKIACNVTGRSPSIVTTIDSGAIDVLEGCVLISEKAGQLNR